MYGEPLWKVIGAHLVAFPAVFAACYALGWVYSLVK